MRTPVSERSLAYPDTSAPGSGSSTHSTPRSPSSSTVRLTEAGSSAGSMSPGIRQAWLSSTMISIVEPTALRPARTAARPSASRSRTERIVKALKPSSGSESADPARPSANEALVGRDTCHRRIEPRAWHRVPCGMKKRVERQPQAPHLDAGDLHLLTGVEAAGGVLAPIRHSPYEIGAAIGEGVLNRCPRCRARRLPNRGLIVHLRIQPERYQHHEGAGQGGV